MAKSNEKRDDDDQKKEQQLNGGMYRITDPITWFVIKCVWKQHQSRTHTHTHTAHWANQKWIICILFVQRCCCRRRHRLHRYRHFSSCSYVPYSFSSTLVSKSLYLDIFIPYFSPPFYPSDRANERKSTPKSLFYVVKSELYLFNRF